MVESTAARDEAGDVDPSLESILPQRSPRRNLVFVVLGMLALVAAWLSPNLLRPELFGDGGPQWWVVFEETDQVLVSIRLDPTGPSSTIESISEAPGAEIDGVWVFRDSGDVGRVVEDPADPAEALSGWYPGQSLDASRLPQRVDSGATDLDLVILWTITDCRRLGGARSLEEVELRTPIGTVVRRPLYDRWGNVFDGLSFEWMSDEQACP